MIPDNTLSSQLEARVLLYPDSLPFSANRDYEMGGVAISDPSAGLRVQPWTIYKDADGVLWVAPLTSEVPAPTPVLTEPEATWIGLTFDRNMNVVICWYREDTGSSYLYWYDPVATAYVTTEYSGTRCPRVCHDDKRPEADAWSDVLFCYISSSNSLALRLQRERYEVEHVLASLGPKQPYFSRMGMGVNNRIVFEFSTWKGAS